MVDWAHHEHLERWYRTANKSTGGEYRLKAHGSQHTHQATVVLLEDLLSRCKESVENWLYEFLFLLIGPMWTTQLRLRRYLFGLVDVPLSSANHLTGVLRYMAKCIQPSLQFFEL
jgi:hypothetical protein